MAGPVGVPLPSSFRVGEFEVDSRSGELRKNGVLVDIQELPFRTLLLLVKKAPEIVTREELRRELWSEDVFVDFQHGINSTIKRLRQSLGDSADMPNYVETVGRRGYRLVASVEFALRQEPSRQLPFIVPAEHSSQPGTTAPPHRRNWITVCIGIVAVVLGWQTWQRIRGQAEIAKSTVAAQRLDSNVRHGTGTIPAPEPAISPLMGLGGEQRMPTFSPDGSRIAFLFQTPTPQKSGIYVMVAGSQSLLQLSANGADSDPAWSPDGRFIAFLRNSDESFSIWLVPTLGGSERRLYTGVRSPWEGPVSLSFSHDGQQIAFAEWNRETQQNSIKILSLSDSSVRSLTAPPHGYHDSAPAFSPKGNWLAFVRWTGPIFVDDIFVIPAAGGEPRQITFDHQRIFSAPAWTPDDKEILFSSTRAGMKSLWRIPSGGGKAASIVGSGPSADHPSVSSTGELAYEYGIEDENLWRIDLRDRLHATGPARPLLSAKTSNLMPDFSPDGRRIVFESDRSGYEEIWTCDADGSNPVQVTRLERYSGSPRWSPDGHFIAFDYRSQLHTEVYLVEAGTGGPRRLAGFSDADSVVPGWSRDGQWVYFASNRGGRDFHIWKVPVGGGDPIQVTSNSGFRLSESPDARSFYTKLSGIEIMTVAPEGTETTFQKAPGPDNWANWVLADGGIYFVDTQRNGGSRIKFLDFRKRAVTLIAKLEKPSFYGLTLAPDGRSLVFAQHDRTEHDIVLVKNFY